MAILENRVKTENGVIELYHFCRFIVKKVIIGFFLVCSVYLLYFPANKISTLSLEFSGSLISVVVGLSESIFEKVNLIKSKLIYFRDLESENIKLKFELAQLKRLEDSLYQIRAENIALKSLLKVISDIKSEVKITARLLSVSNNPISKIALIGAGVKDGIILDQLVLDERGLVGRVVEVSENYAKVMTINDARSRIPVVTSRSAKRGVLAVNGDNMHILYLDDMVNLDHGEHVLTSGDGKIYPPGLLVATISSNISGEVKLLPVMDLENARFVTVCQYNQ